MTVAADSSARFRHLAWFYQGRDDYLAAVRSLVQAGQGRGEAVLLAIPGRKARLMGRELGDGSADVTLVDMAALGRNPARIIPALLAWARQRHGQPACCIGEPVWPGRTAAETQEAIRHEALVNLAFRDRPATFFCLYDGAGLPRSVIADAASTHPAVVSDRREAPSASYLGPPALPTRCNEALRRPPAHAAALRYAGDLRAVRGFVAGRASGAGLGPARIADLVLAVSELAANTLRHTGGGGTVQAWATRDEFICQVTDSGQITDPLARHRTRPELPLGGEGLWLVNEVCDLVEARTGQGGTTTRLHMRRPGLRTEAARRRYRTIMGAS
jgi:anti-sigma regulatory factor (Ser/Thr protein kinase)